MATKSAPKKEVQIEEIKKRASLRLDLLLQKQSIRKRFSKLGNNLADFYDLAELTLGEDEELLTDLCGDSGDKYAEVIGEIWGSKKSITKPNDDGET